METFKEEKFFPIVTFSLAVIILVTFLFTVDEIVSPISKNTDKNFCEITCPATCKNYFGYQICAEADYNSCKCFIPKLRLYENLFGFKILNFPQLTDTSSLIQFLSYLVHFFVTLITYTFLHADMYHLIGNMVMLIIAGIALEEKLGKGFFLLVYIFSGNIAAIFDIIGRVTLGIPFSIPFIGSSGAVFGLIAVGALVKPMEKIPTLLVLLTFLPFVYLVSGFEIFSEVNAVLILFIFTLVLIIFILPVFSSYIPLIVAAIVYLSSWLINFLIKYPLMVSNIGHLGGMLGGIIAFFLFAREKIT